MADTFGATESPTQATTPPGDLALARIGDCLRTVINARCGSAWTAAALGPDGTPPIRRVITNDPSGYVLDDCELPVLFVYRSESAVEQRAEDLYEDASTFSVVWMLPHDRSRDIDERESFFNTVAKTVASMVRVGRDPLWTWDGDPEPRAAAIAADADSVMTTVATTAAPVSYSGGDFNGILGGTFESTSPVRPRLQPTITTTPAVGAYNTADPVVWTVVDAFGLTSTRSARLTNPDGGETIGPLEDVRSVTRVDLPAMLDTSGTISLGTGAVVARGSNLLTAAGLTQLRMTGWKPDRLKVDELDASGQPARGGFYMSVRMTLVGIEWEDPDLTTLPASGLDATVSKDGLVLTTTTL